MPLAFVPQSRPWLSLVFIKVLWKLRWHTVEQVIHSLFRQGAVSTFTFSTRILRSPPAGVIHTAPTHLESLSCGILFIRVHLSVKL